MPSAGLSCGPLSGTCPAGRLAAKARALMFRVPNQLNCGTPFSALADCFAQLFLVACDDRYRLTPSACRDVESFLREPIPDHNHGIHRLTLRPMRGAGIPVVELEVVGRKHPLFTRIVGNVHSALLVDLANCDKFPVDRLTAGEPRTVFLQHKAISHTHVDFFRVENAEAARLFLRQHMALAVRAFAVNLPVLSPQHF